MCQEFVGVDAAKDGECGLELVHSPINREKSPRISLFQQIEIGFRVWLVTNSLSLTSCLSTSSLFCGSSL